MDTTKVPANRDELIEWLQKWELVETSAPPEAEEIMLHFLHEFLKAAVERGAIVLNSAPPKA